MIAQPGQNLHAVYGAAGTGKSFLLNMLKHKFITMGYHPVVLAPTGIAAYTAGGQTIDRFFGLNMHQQHTYNPVRVDDYLKVNPKTVLLIDECSMLSAQKLEEIHNQATIATENNEIFGGLKTVFF
ncbi:hypothetical protein, partial, partial [Parasitella parasitica]